MQKKFNQICICFISLDTPGLENENRSKPEETKIISAGAGLSQPEDVANKIVHDSLVRVDEQSKSKIIFYSMSIFVFLSER